MAPAWPVLDVGAFETATGWTANPAGTDTATLGQWVRGDPAATTSSGAKQLGTNDVEGARQVALKQHPIGRLGVPEDVVGAIDFLTGPGAAFLTGATLTVDGGGAT